MGMVAFTRNYSDHSNNTGYQFEFHCDKCGNGWRSDFQTSKLGMATGILRAASSFFGGLGSAARAGDQMKDLLRGKAWDEAFAVAVAQGKERFKQCTRCGLWVCPEACWNEKAALCEACAPDLAEAAAAAQAQVAVEQLYDKARATDQTENANLKQKRPAACPHCNARVGDAKFCPECGKPVKPPADATCACGTKIPPKAKFCPECGAPRPG